MPRGCLGDGVCQKGKNQGESQGGQGEGAKGGKGGMSEVGTGVYLKEKC